MSGRCVTLLHRNELPKRLVLFANISNIYLLTCYFWVWKKKHSHLIQHPCPAPLTSYFPYCPLFVNHLYTGSGVVWALGVCRHYFCVIIRLCLTQIKAIHPLFKPKLKHVQDISSKVLYPHPVQWSHKWIKCFLKQRPDNYSYWYFKGEELW